MFAYRSVAPNELLQLDLEVMATSSTLSEESGAVLGPGTLGCLARYWVVLVKGGFDQQSYFGLLM